MPASVAALLLAALAQAGPAPAGPPSASAVVERSVVRDRIEEDGTCIRVVSQAILLRDVAAVASFGQIGSLYRVDQDEVTIEDVVVEKADGRRVSVPTGGAEDINPFGMSGATPADIRVRRLTIPGLEPGDRLRYRIRQETRSLFPGVAFGAWSFEAPSASLPEQVYELDLPAGSRIRARVRDGFPGLSESLPAPAGRSLRRLVLRAAAAGPTDDGAISEATDPPDVLYTTFDSWQQVGRWWWELARERVVPDADVRAEAARLVAGATTPAEKLRALHAFVALKVRYFSIGFGTGRLQPRKAGEVLASRYGDCKDKHALLAALAAAVGIEVRPVLVSTTTRALVDDAPAPAQFDHLISVATPDDNPSNWIWLDATAALAPDGFLEPSVRGKRALLVDPRQGGRVVEIPSRLPYPTFFRSDTQATLDEKGPLKAHVTWTLRDDREPLLRAAMLAAASLPEAKRRELAKALAAEWDRGEADHLSHGDPTSLSAPFRIEYDVTHGMGASVFDKAWDLWLPLPDFELPAADASAAPDAVAARLTLATETVTRGECRLPPGMKARPPLAISLERPFASYRSVYSVEEGVMRVERTLRLHTTEVKGSDAAAYEAFRKAVGQDRRQQFPIEAWARSGVPAEDAAALHARGYAALERGEAAAAEELFRRVVALDPKHPYASNNLGRALRQQGRAAEALAAFRQQIEVSPFDEYAWANVGDMLAAAGDASGAEQAYAKQIEIAPLRPWAYRGLGALRASQKRFAEAADQLRHATRAEPADVATWLQLAYACVASGQPAEARSAVERVAELDKSGLMQVRAASILALTGDAAAAGRLAEAALPAVRAALARVEPGKLALGQVAMTGDLAEGWRLAGLGALADGDVARAEGLLRAAWKWTLHPEAAAALAQLEVRVGRKQVARETLARGAAFAGGPGNAAAEALREVVPDRALRDSMVERGKIDLLAQRTRALPGPSPGAVGLDLLLLVDADGRITDARLVQARDSDERTLDSLRGRIVGLRLGLPGVEPPTAHVRRASVGCSSASACALVLDVIQLPTAPSPR